MSERQSYPLNFRQLEETDARLNAPFADGCSTRYSEIITLFCQRTPILLIARYDCFVAGKPTDSVDYQVRSYDVPDHTDLDVMLSAEPIHRYRNSDDEEVEWRFAEIVATEWEPRFDSGEEVIGFITGRPTPATE